jgi:autotransporter translocation and assembly factor TamB
MPEIPAEILVTLSIPDNFWVLTNEARIQVGGDLVIETIQGDLVIQGSLSTKEGRYSILGTTFKIFEGNLSFDKISEIDPLLDITASTIISRDTVFLSITGNLSNPEVSLSGGSGSELTHQELLLLLTLNTSADSLNMLDMVEDRSKGLVSEYLYRMIEREATRMIGVDKLEIAPVNDQYLWEGGDYSITVGNYVAPKIYLSYTHQTGSGEVGTFGDIQVEYRFTENLQLIGRRDRQNHNDPENYKLELYLKWPY